MSQLTARRPFEVKKWPFKALFGQIRLADTELAATRSYRQIKALALVLCGHQKINPAIAEKAILWPIYIYTSVKKSNFCYFWKAIVADPLNVRTRF